MLVLVRIPSRPFATASVLDLMRLCDERPSHPQYIRGILKVLNSRWKIGMSYDAVGCASRRGTSPEPLVPEIDGVD